MTSPRPAVRAVATAAVRDAKDGRAFCADVLQATGQKIRIISGKEEKTISNQIISLAQLKEEINTNQLLLKPLFFVQDFAKTNKTERDILLWSFVGGFLSFLLGLLVSFIRELR